ncbi:MAG: cytochrome c nitrite reductase small subunit [Phycisphaerae bacterium]|nr:cytochrome c nitrite reductase small subunit [Phycisphaerae bacterium]
MKQTRTGSNQTPRRPRAIGLAAFAAASAVGILIGASAGTFSHAEGASYLSNDPRACVNCHVMRDHYDGWQKASHHAVATCNDCHVPQDIIGKYFTKADHGWRHSRGFTLNDFHEPIQIKESSRRVVLDNCVRCHQGMVDGISHAAVPGSAGVEAIDCIRCHARVAHGPRR